MNLPTALNCLLALCGLTFALRAADSSSHPNFVFIMGEAQGWASCSVKMGDAVLESKSPLTRAAVLERLAGVTEAPTVRVLPAISGAGRKFVHVKVTQ